MQHPLDIGALYCPAEIQPDHGTHRYRSFMIEEILTDHHPEHKVGAPTRELLKFGVHALLSTRAFRNQMALKADQTNLVKFPLSPLPCTLSSPFGSPLLSAAANLHVGVPSHHLPLDPHLRGKLDHGSDGTGKSKKGRRSRTVFTELQLMGLEKRFEKQKYLSTPDRIDLAESLGLSQLQVKTWYQNRRMKWKKIVLQGEVWSHQLNQKAVQRRIRFRAMSNSLQLCPKNQILPPNARRNARALIPRTLSRKDFIDSFEPSDTNSEFECCGKDEQWFS